MNSLIMLARLVHNSTLEPRLWVALCPPYITELIRVRVKTTEVLIMQCDSLHQWEH